MNRQQKRQCGRKEVKEETERKKMSLWFASWTPQQKEFHKNMVSAMLDEVNEITEKVLDTSYIAAMIEKLDISLEQCEEVAKQANEYMIEVKKIIDEKKEGYFDMLKDEKLRSEIKEEAKIIIKENTKINNLRVIDALKENYDLPAKDFQIIIKEARKELEEAVMKELESSISEGEKQISKSAKVAAEGMEKLAEEKEEITLDTPGIKSNGLKIKSIEIEGKYGTYIKGSDGVKASKRHYLDIADLEEDKMASYETINNKKQEYLKQLNEINDNIKYLDELEKEKQEEFAEIAAVFEM